MEAWLNLGNGKGNIQNTQKARTIIINKIKTGITLICDWLKDDERDFRMYLNRILYLIEINGR